MIRPCISILCVLLSSVSSVFFFGTNKVDRWRFVRFSLESLGFLSKNLDSKFETPWIAASRAIQVDCKRTLLIHLYSLSFGPPIPRCVTWPIGFSSEHRSRHLRQSFKKVLKKSSKKSLLSTATRLVAYDSERTGSLKRRFIMNLKKCIVKNALKFNSYWA